MTKIKPKNYTKAKKIICEWTNTKKFLYHSRMLNFNVRHGMIVEKKQEKISLKQNKCLEKYIIFITQKLKSQRRF